ncbi:MAG: hypothetical protein ACQEW8_11650 [Actinomycetota bacterium]
MTRIARLLIAPAALLALTLGGCAPAAPEPPNEADVQEWLDQWDHAAETDPPTLGSAAGRPMTLSDYEDGSDIAGVPEGTTITSDSPIDVTEVLFSCFGVEEMSAAFSSMAEDVSYGLTEEGLVCADSPHVIADGLDLSQVMSISMSAVEEHGYGAWAMEIRGTE